MILSGAGVGGGSLNYANTLYEPLAPFYADAQWGHITDWRAELAPFYDQAKRMLGVVEYPHVTPSDEVMRAVAEEMGVGDTFQPTPVGVFFGEPGVEVDDPFFGGAGPARRGCIECGECMTGCRHGAKNTLLTELPVPGRAGRRRGPPDDDGDRGAPRRRALRGRHGPHRTQAARAATHLHRRPRRVRRRDHGHPEAAAPPPRRGPPPARLAPARRAHPHELRGHPRRPHVRAATPTSPGASPSPRRSTPTTTPTSSRSATARAATPWACSPPRSPTAAGGAARSRWLEEVARHPVTMLRNLCDAEVVGADDHRPRHADARQLHHLLHREGPARAARA